MHVKAYGRFMIAVMVSMHVASLVFSKTPLLVAMKHSGQEERRSLKFKALPPLPLRLSNP